MHIPKGYTEDEVVEIIQRVAGRLANKFKFGYHELDDMKQQGMMLAIEALDKHDGVRPLENFLWSHVHNRLYNFKRDNYGRPDKPCDNCPLKAYKKGVCTAYNNMDDCEPYSKWNKRNMLKRNLMATREHIDIRGYDTLSAEMEAKEVMDIIESNIPVHMREDWVRYINKLRLSKNRRETIQSLILKILKENNIDYGKEKDTREA